jgi:hypothetical protein
MSVNQASLLELEKFAGDHYLINTPLPVIPLKETPKTPRPVPTPPTPAQQSKPIIRPAATQSPVTHLQAKKRLTYEQVSYHQIMV